MHHFQFYKYTLNTDSTGSLRDDINRIITLVNKEDLDREVKGYANYLIDNHIIPYGDDGSYGGISQLTKRDIREVDEVLQIIKETGKSRNEIYENTFPKLPDDDELLYFHIFDNNELKKKLYEVRGKDISRKLYLHPGSLALIVLLNLSIHMDMVQFIRLLTSYIIMIQI